MKKNSTHCTVPFRQLTKLHVRQSTPLVSPADPVRNAAQSDQNSNFPGQVWTYSGMYIQQNGYHYDLWDVQFCCAYQTSDVRSTYPLIQLSFCDSPGTRSALANGKMAASLAQDRAVRVREPRFEAPRARPYGRFQSVYTMSVGQHII